MGFLPYLGFTLLGDAVWTALLAYGGYALGRDYRLIAGYLHLVLWVGLAAAIPVGGGLLFRRMRRRRRIGRESRPT
jgi:membrane protein DedA with SNARE-associated domain